jgi:hypothetical protein
MAYELWDLRSRNLIVDFESIDEAVAAVRAYVDANDGDDLLLVEDRDGDREHGYSLPSASRSYT